MRPPAILGISTVLVVAGGPRGMEQSTVRGCRIEAGASG